MDSWGRRVLLQKLNHTLASNPLVPVSVVECLGV
jgi:hypothetical protein